MTRMKFTRRFYNHPSLVFEDLRHLKENRKLIRRTMRETISPDFRERLMMTVTEVNGCKYCRDFHLKESIKSGVSKEELKELLEGRIPKDTPPDEYEALAYAQHWAENNALPEVEMVEKLIETYGQEIADAIHIVLRMIRIGNLSGNLLDYIIFKLSFGRYGLEEKKDPFSIIKL